MEATEQHILYIWRLTWVIFGTTDARKNVFKCFEIREILRGKIYALVQGVNKFVPVCSAFIVRCGLQLDRLITEGDTLH